MEKNKDQIDLLKKSGVQKNSIENLVKARSNLENAKNFHKHHKFEAAKTYYRKALSFFESINDQDPISRIYTGLAVIMVETGQIDSAERLLRDCLNLSEAQDSSTARVLYNLSSILMMQKKYDEAEKYLQKNLTLREKIGDEVGKAMSSVNLALISYEKGDILRAIKLLTQAIEIQAKVKDYPELIRTLKNLSFIMKKIGDTKRADKYLNTAVKIAEQIHYLIIS